MKEIMSVLFEALVVTVVAISLGCKVYGAFLAFSASLVLGIICLFVAPMFLIIGSVKWIAGVNLATAIVDIVKVHVK
jgi:hypothetical protein